MCVCILDAVFVEQCAERYLAFNRMINIMEWDARVCVCCTLDIPTNGNHNDNIHSHIKMLYGEYVSGEEEYEHLVCCFVLCACRARSIVLYSNSAV